MESVEGPDSSSFSRSHRSAADLTSPGRRQPVLMLSIVSL